MKKTVLLVAISMLGGCRDWSAQTRAEFTVSCMAVCEVGPDCGRFCLCYLEGVEAKLTEDEMRATPDRMARGAPVPQEIADAARACR